MTEPLVYLNGELVPATAARLPIYDAGVVQGATVTELTRTFAGRLFRFDDHLDRLFGSLRAVRFDIGLSVEQVRDIALALVEHNAALVDGSTELGLVQFVTAGPYPTYASMVGQPPRAAPTVCFHTFPLPLARWATAMRDGARLVTPEVRHVPPECYNPAVKYRSRLHFYLADQEARAIDPQATALLLDLAGNVTETNAANFLIVERGAIVSPTLANILPGISRKTVIELAGELGIRFVERDISLPEALAADEALLTSTPYCVLPVARLNGVTIGDGQPGAVFSRLIEAWNQRVGLDIREQILAAKGSG